MLPVLVFGMVVIESAIENGTGTRTKTRIATEIGQGAVVAFRITCKDLMMSKRFLHHACVSGT